MLPRILYRNHCHRQKTSNGRSQRAATTTVRRVVRVSQNYMVKYGWLVEPIEGENMLYVHEKTTRIRIPRVYAIYCEKGRDWRGIDRTCTFIVMEYIDGQNLAAVWGKTLNYEGKTSVIAQLRDAFDELRSLAPPSPTYFGSIRNRQLRDGMFLTEEKGVRSSNGPFQTEDELTEALIQKMESAEYGEFPADMAAYYRRVVPRVLRSGDGRPVFSHSDLQNKNVMLQPDGKVVIVDWATAGWYPVY
ncbi:kinase-like domain-containing protein [Diplogelasinospora grovesii]|uniref:Kinase-like domain-containing protein n=1 Tax=Diplogelasinospora grovesii TaxID=303347 RepID=A0AAN6N5I1_9PEZI|nr:kinase-like domain-containing protein [Diplogelasinospora grovesii]